MSVLAWSNSATRWPAETSASLSPSENSRSLAVVSGELIGSG